MERLASLPIVPDEILGQFFWGVTTSDAEPHHLDAVPAPTPCSRKLCGSGFDYYCQFIFINTTKFTLCGTCSGFKQNYAAPCGSGPDSGSSKIIQLRAVPARTLIQAKCLCSYLRFRH
jgi:hypothetical protein